MTDEKEMSERRLYAALVLNGLLSNSDYMQAAAASAEKIKEDVFDRLVRQSFAFADEILRSKG